MLGQKRSGEPELLDPPSFFLDSCIHCIVRGYKLCLPWQDPLALLCWLCSAALPLL